MIENRGKCMFHANFWFSYCGINSYSIITNLFPLDVVQKNANFANFVTYGKTQIFHTVPTVLTGR